MGNFRLNNPEIIAEIYYLSSEEKGRGYPVFNGYNGQFFYDDMNWDAIQEFIDKKICMPGEIVKVKMQTQSPYLHVGNLWTGKPFEIREGTRTVGKGTILEILRQDLNYWDNRAVGQSLELATGKELKQVGSTIKNRLRIAENLQKIEMQFKPNNRKSMIRFECSATKDRHTLNSRWLAKDIIRIWNEELALIFKNTFIKSSVTSGHFIYSFAVTDNFMTTGEILVKR